MKTICEICGSEKAPAAICRKVAEAEDGGTIEGRTAIVTPHSLLPLMGRHKMRVLLFTSSFPPVTGGVARHSFEIGKHISKLGAYVCVLTPFRCNYDGYDDQNAEFEIIRMKLPRSRIPRFLCYCYYLFKTIRDKRIDIILSTQWKPTGVITYLVSRFTETPYTISAHGAEITCAEDFIEKQLMRMTMGNSERVFAVSDFTRSKLIERGIDPPRIVVVPNGVDTNKFRSSYSTTQLKQLMGLGDRKIILTVSRLDNRKGHRAIIEVVKELRQYYPNILYLIIGTGPEEQKIVRLIDKENLSGNVLLLGYVNDEELIKYYNVCDVFVMVSADVENERDIEGFGIVYLEANACGKPVVGGNMGGEKEAILDGETGLLVDPYDVSQIANAIRKLLDNKRFAAELGENGRKRVRSELTWENSARKIVKELQGINASETP